MASYVSFTRWQTNFWSKNPSGPWSFIRVSIKHSIVIITTSRLAETLLSDWSRKTPRFLVHSYYRWGILECHGSTGCSCFCRDVLQPPACTTEWSGKSEQHHQPDVEESLLDHFKRGLKVYPPSELHALLVGDLSLESCNACWVYMLNSE